MPEGAARSVRKGDLTRGPGRGAGRAERGPLARVPPPRPSAGVGQRPRGSATKGPRAEGPYLP